MPLRIAVTCSIGAGENIVVDACQWNPVTGEILHESVDDVLKLIEDGLQAVDDRASNLRLRILEVNGIREYFSPEEWQKVVSILDIMSGRQDAQRVKMIWDSIREENEALANGRLEAQMNGVDNV